MVEPSKGARSSLNDEPLVLTEKEQIRYSRHLLLSEVGMQGQLKLKNAHVCVVGCGGLGSPALLYLAAAGIGKLTFIDDDEVDLSNLQRQILYKINHLGQRKAKAASKVLASLNNQIDLQPVHVRIDRHNIMQHLSSADIVLDCSDNYQTRYLLNHFCQTQKGVLISGAAIGTHGQVMCFDFRQPSPCYACIFPQSDEEAALNCDNFGVLGPLLGMIGSMQALSAVNVLLGHVSGSSMRQVDGMSLSVREFKLHTDPECHHCRHI
ncbi:HesA/MoeB/ThiF family protein [Pseudoalteromonas sp. MMG005]|uniref:HesA/MoeB/ThiF family protein n=1 Tax=Pseudoalteromonas sp. MMG005 TaxID=2822682 RepID=UPI001B3A4541|nr:HesA/MoeB/ThiF family protein [Pseudoalteromonas sp. MMG005]MBQ4844216.1 HesA/MoeB/ThiF family protein [Pseudoalteromonas sp. MMG005]